MEVKSKFQLADIADSYVFLTKLMRALFPEKPYSIIEVFCHNVNLIIRKKRQRKAILYTGSLNEALGIRTLVDSFLLIKDSEYRLWICGVGDTQEFVEEAKEDARIQYMGYLPKHEIIFLQTKCEVLINHRPKIKLFAKYSFSSKAME